MVLDRNKQVVFVSEAGQRMLGFQDSGKNPVGKQASNLIGRDLLTSLFSDVISRSVHAH